MWSSAPIVLYDSLFDKLEFTDLTDNGNNGMIATRRHGGIGRHKGERWERRLWRDKRPERVAAVDKIEEKRKPEDFIGHRNRAIPQRPRRCTLDHHGTN